MDAWAVVDPGPRHAQIAFLSASLARSLKQLRETLAWAVAGLPADHPTALNLHEATAGMTQLAQAVMGYVSVTVCSQRP